MKSIRRFRLTRQALKQVPPGPVESGVQDNDESLEFPLGPRLFRKHQTSPPQPKGKGHLSIEERDLPEHLTLVPPDDAPEAPPVDSAGHEARVVKIIPESLVKSVVEAADGPAASVSEGPEHTTKSAQHLPGAQGESVPVHDLKGNDAAVVSDTPAPAEEEASVETPPAPLEIVGSQVSGKPEQSKQAPAKRSKASGSRRKAVKGPEDRLNRYAVKVGALSYVLIDEDGHPVKKSGRGR